MKRNSPPSKKLYVPATVATVAAVAALLPVCFTLWNHFFTPPRLFSADGVREASRDSARISLSLPPTELSSKDNLYAYDMVGRLTRASDAERQAWLQATSERLRRVKIELIKKQENDEGSVTNLENEQADLEAILRIVTQELATLSIKGPPTGKRLPNDMVISPYDPDRKPRSIASLKSDAPPANRKLCPVTGKPFLVPDEPRVADFAPAPAHDAAAAKSLTGTSGAREMNRESTPPAAAAAAPALPAKPVKETEAVRRRSPSPP